MPRPVRITVSASSERLPGVPVALGGREEAVSPDGHGDTAFLRFVRGASAHADDGEAHADSCMNAMLMKMVPAIAGTADVARQ